MINFFIIIIAIAASGFRWKNSPFSLQNKIPRKSNMFCIMYKIL